MKFNFKKIILGVGVLLGISSSVYFGNLGAGTKNEEPTEKLSAKFEQSNIKGDFDLEKNVIKQKINHKDDPIAKVGEENSTEFVPNLEISRWDGEVKFKVKPNVGNIATKDKDLNIVNGIEFKTPKVDYKFYEVKNLGASTSTIDEGAFEFEYILNEQPATTTFEFDIETTNLIFEKQPSYKEEYTVGQNTDAGVVATITDTEVRDADGNLMFQRPENIIDGYALYNKTKAGDYTAFFGGKNYRAGQAGIIYRIKVIDANGDWKWCDQNIENKWIIDCSENADWFKTAKYPVVVDPTFGYLTAGASNAAVSSCVCLHGTSYRYTATTGDTVIYLVMNGYSLGGTTGFDMAVYDIGVTDVPVNRLSAGMPVVFPNSYVWRRTNLLSQGLTAGTSYCTAFGNDGASTERVSYNSGSGTQRSSDTTTGALPATWTQSDTSATLYSVYSVYKPANTIDYYDEYNFDSFNSVYGDKYGQSFTNTNASTLTDVYFKLRKYGTPIGALVAKIYAHSGTYGTDGVPTGTALATSDDVDATTFTTAYGGLTYKFHFSGANQISLSASTYYVVTLEPPVTYDSSNNIDIFYDSSSPTHSGNYSYYSGSWTGYNSADLVFYVVGTAGGGGGGTTNSPMVLINNIPVTTIKPINSISYTILKKFNGLNK